MNRYYKYFKYIRIANPHIKAKRVLEYIKTIEKIHGLKVLGQ